MTEKRKTRLSLASVFLTFFVDNLCWSIVFPIFAPYFLDLNTPLFSMAVSPSTRAMILGFFVMAFSLGQFLGAPVVGEYADKNGRRKALMFTVFFTFLGLAITAWSVKEYNLILLFIGRLATGIFASNASICLASVSDLSKDEKEKTKNFGYFSVIGGLSFILGAFVGGKLSDPTLEPYFTPHFPIWIACGMTFLNFLFVLFVFQETTQIDPTLKFNFLESIQNIKRALRTDKIKKVYAIYFLFLFSWTILFQFIPVVMVQRFGFTGSNIGDLALYMGICWAIGSGYLNVWLALFFSPLRILETCLLIFTALTAFVIFPTHIYGVVGLLGLCVIVGGLAWPLCTSLISSLAPSHMQGKIMGMSQSVQSLAMTFAPAIGGIAFNAFLGFPFLLGAFASLIAGVLYFTLKEE